MANRVLTVFQNLDRTITGNWDAVNQKHINKYDMSSLKGSDVIYKAKDKEDYIKTKLELQQNAYLSNVWKKANADLTIQAFNGLNNIKLMYRDAELMDAFPEIGAALDIVSEESTIVSEKNGQVVNVYSSSPRIKSVLEDLFVNRLDLQVTAVMIIRAMCKYGNQFMLLNIDNKMGITGWRQLPVYNVERLENGINNQYSSQVVVTSNNTKNNEDLSTKFVWTDAQNSNQVEYRNWQIGHFRLLSNSLFLPYGCIVGNARIETECGYKEMRDIQIGDNVVTFNTETQEKEISKVTMFMPKGEKDVYKVKTQHFEIEGTPDHKLLSLENGVLVYKEIQELQNGDLLVCNASEKEVNESIKIDKRRPLFEGTRTDWWDKYIDNIPDFVNEDFARLFGFMLGDGWLSHGYHVMFALGTHQTLNERYIKLLEKFSGKKSSFERYSDNRKKTLPYHTCFVGSKMLYEIMLRMGFVGNCYTKRIPNWLYQCGKEIREAFLDGIMDADGYLHFSSKDTLHYTIELANEELIRDIKTLIHSLGYKVGNVNVRNRIGHKSKLADTTTVVCQHTSFYISYCKKNNVQEKTNDSIIRKNNQIKFEKIKKITFEGKKQTYDFTVSNNNSNFFANGIVTHNCSYLNNARRHFRMLSLMEDLMLIYRLERSIERRIYKIYVGAIDDADVKAYVEEIANNFKRTPIVDPQTGQIDLRKNLLDVSQDIFIPVRNENAPTPIDTLAPAQNLTAMDDIKFVQNKVLTALRIPKSFLNFEEAAGDGKNLALMDIRFTRTVNRIQQAFLMELTKIASIHLYLLGFEDELTNFSLSMNNPSTQAEQLQIENIQKKLSAVRDAVSDPGNGLPAMSMTRALKEIMKWSDDDIQENFEEIRLEKAIAMELEKTGQIIKKTGIFDTVDRMYGEPGAEYMDDQQQGQGDEGGDMGGPSGGGGMPPMDIGGGEEPMGEIDELGTEGSSEEGDISGNEGELPMGGEEERPMESLNNTKPLILEHINKKNMQQFARRNETVVKRAKVYNDALLVNEEFDRMIKSLDEVKLED